MSSSGASGGVSQAAVNALAYGALQNGVVNNGDLAQTAQSINTGTGALSVTFAAAAPCWLSTAAGILAPVTVTQGARVIAPAALPASTKYAVIGVELIGAATFTTVKGADTATELNTGALIAANTPAVTAGNLRVMDIAVWNNAGVYNYGNQTTVATQGVNWIDRRPWARGAFSRLPYTAAGGQFSTTNGVVWQSGALQQRIECTGVPLRMIVSYTVAVSSNSGYIEVVPYVDGAWDASSERQTTVNATTTTGIGTSVVFTLTPSAGTHLLDPRTNAQSSVNGVYGSSTVPLLVTLEEIVGQNASNGAA